MGQLFNDANVVITMKGLGILHNNGKRWESIMPRDIDDHNLKIFVKKIDSNGNQIGSENKYTVSADTEKIMITTNNEYSSGAQLPNPFFKQASPFSYDIVNDNEQDGRWIIDLSEELHEKPVKLRNKTGCRLTLLTISDATLYTYELHRKDRPYEMINALFGNPLPLSTRRIKNPRVMAAFVGLDIRWNNPVNPETVIDFGSTQISLPRDAAVARYEVFIDNNCPEDKCPFQGDFRVYYDHLVDMGDEIFDESIPNLPNMLPLNVNDVRDFKRVSVAQFFQLVKAYGGKTNDCGKALCTELDGMKSLEELLQQKRLTIS